MAPQQHNAGTLLFERAKELKKLIWHGRVNMMGYVKVVPALVRPVRNREMPQQKFMRIRTSFRGRGGFGARPMKHNKEGP